MLALWRGVRLRNRAGPPVRVERRVRAQPDGFRPLSGGGAERSFWLRTPAGQLRGAADQVRKILTQHENVMVESNSLLELAEPDLFLMVLDFAQADFKESSARFLRRADAIVVVDRGLDAAQPGATPAWKNVAHGLWQGKPRFPVKPPDYVTLPMVEFVSSHASYASANTGA
jgi:hypothetical protein